MFSVTIWIHIWNQQYRINTKGYQTFSSPNNFRKKNWKKNISFFILGTNLYHFHLFWLSIFSHWIACKFLRRLVCNLIRLHVKKHNFILIEKFKILLGYFQKEIKYYKSSAYVNFGNVKSKNKKENKNVLYFPPKIIHFLSGIEWASFLP